MDNLTIDEALAKIDSSISKIEELTHTLCGYFTQELMGIVAQRIFNFNGSKDVNGDLLPFYRRPHMGASSEGNKTSLTWDLQSSGDLLNSLQFANENGNFIIGFLSSQNEKMSELETRSGQIIFEASQSEIDQAWELTERWFEEQFNNLF